MFRAPLSAVLFVFPPGWQFDPLRLLPVIGSVQLGELLCDSLAEAEDAPTVNFPISPVQVSP